MSDSILEKGVRFCVYGKPKGKARPRVTRNGTYTPKSTKQYQGSIKQAYAFAGMKRFTGPVKVVIAAFFGYASLKASDRRRIMSGAFIPYPHRPDADNVSKAVLDALNGIAWDDDAAVTELTVKKFYGEPRTVIFIANSEEKQL